jgi:hypothetical protein
VLVAVLIGVTRIGEPADHVDGLAVRGDRESRSWTRAAGRLARAHARAARVLVLAQARQVQASVQALLRGGRPRHRQAREVLRVNGGLLAHISLLLTDLGDDAAREEYGNAALAYLREAGASEVTAWYVLAKIARWRHQYARAADLARHGRPRRLFGARWMRPSARSGAAWSPR